MGMLSYKNILLNIWLFYFYNFNIFRLVFYCFQDFQRDFGCYGDKYFVGGEEVGDFLEDVGYQVGFDGYYYQIVLFYQFNVIVGGGDFLFLLMIKIILKLFFCLDMYWSILMYNQMLVMVVFVGD